MYLPIFIAARNTSRRAEIAREAKLAKRIGAVVFTNFICHFLPFAFFFVVTATGSFAGSSAEVSVGVVVGCLVILPGINSIINSILYGYKNDRFQKSFQERIHCLTKRENSSRQERTLNFPPGSPPVILLRHITNDTSGMASGQNRSLEKNEASRSTFRYQCTIALGPLNVRSP